MKKFFAGLDLGQSADFTALAIAERIITSDKLRYEVRHLERFPLGTPYPDIVVKMKALVSTPALADNVTLAIDATGVGAPVVDMFTVAQLPCPWYAIHIHGGDKVTREGRHYRVPKRDLVSVVQVLLQSERLKIGATLPAAKTLIAELLNFRIKIDPQTAHDSYAAWREGIHDDLVLATALATWTAENVTESAPPWGLDLSGFAKTSAWRPQ